MDKLRAHRRRRVTVAKPAAADAAIDYDRAAATLDRLFAEAVALVDQGSAASVPEGAVAAAEIIFTDKAPQSYREALLGCALARLANPSIDLARPYVSHGEGSYNGRTLDERVVNPFLKIHQIPSGKSPFLNLFRRGFRFIRNPGINVRDQVGYAAMIDYIELLQAAEPDEATDLARHLCVEFVRLRNRSRIELVRIIRMTLDQLGAVIAALLRERSGGRFPVFLVAAMFEAIRDRFGAPWEIEVQGINTADAASSAGGDIVIRERGVIVLAIEVTERPIEEPRVVATFVSKISPARIADYLFVHGSEPPTAGARPAAFGYFAQGHDIGFVPVQDWLTNSLATIGSSGRERFIEHFLARMALADIPAPLKLRWNDLVRHVAGTPPA